MKAFLWVRNQMQCCFVCKNTKYKQVYFYCPFITLLLRRTCRFGFFTHKWLRLDISYKAKHHLTGQASSSECLIWPTCPSKGTSALGNYRTAESNVMGWFAKSLFSGFCFCLLVCFSVAASKHILLIMSVNVKAVTPHSVWFQLPLVCSVGTPQARS